jgi:hypothetical protein
MDLAKIPTAKQGRLGLRISCIKQLSFCTLSRQMRCMGGLAERAFHTSIWRICYGLDGYEDVDCLLRIAKYQCAGGGLEH